MSNAASDDTFRALLGLDLVTGAVDITATDRHGLGDRIVYTAPDGEQIPAFLLMPDGASPFAAVLMHHQHNGQRHLGKSEVVGHAGDPLQALGPALVERGIVVLAPDSTCFEDRRRHATGIETPGRRRPAALPGDGGTADPR